MIRRRNIHHNTRGISRQIFGDGDALAFEALPKSP
jgi:hypothetical protein